MAVFSPIVQYILRSMSAYAAPPITVPTGIDIGKVLHGTGQTLTDPGQIGRIIFNVFEVGLGVIGVVVVAIIIIAGFSYLTSGGDSGTVEKSRKALTNAVIGLIIVLFSYFIGHVALRLFGLGSCVNFGQLFANGFNNC